MDNQYGAIERKIATLLSKFPRLKSGIKSAYARAVFLRNKSNARLISASRVLPVGDDRVNTFFGYYDKSPLSEEGFLLCHATVHPTYKKPDSRNGVDILVFSLDNLQLPLLAVRTQVYNWQQGARSHWLNGDQFIFNDYDEKRQRYISRVFSLRDRKEVRRFDHPVQDSFRNRYFLSINYRRIQALRPDYGYRNMPALDAKALANLGNDGIWRIDQNTGDTVMLYTIADVCATNHRPTFDKARHKLNHVMIAPDGKRFVFLHRYFLGTRKLDRLMLGSAVGDPLTVLSDHDMVSHCFWMNNHMILAFMRGPAGKDGYYTVHADTGEIRSLFDGKLDAMGDGHPHVHGDWFITDTYPDKSRMQHLVKADLQTGEVRELGQFFQSFSFGGETRCDLHPRISPDGSKIFFDSVFNGRRKLYMMDVADLGGGGLPQA